MKPNDLGRVELGDLNVIINYTMLIAPSTRCVEGGPKQRPLAAGQSGYLGYNSSLI